MNKNAGFTLIEIVVCVAILSVGLLGLIGLQATALKNTAGSYHKVQANLLAHTIADKIRLNFIADPNATVADLAVNDQVINQYRSNLPFSAQANCFTTNGCTRVQMARNDIYEWKKAIKSILPNGKPAQKQATITCKTGMANCSAPYDAVMDVFTVTISWDENRNGNIDNRDGIDSTKPCFDGTNQITLPDPQPLQYDPCFKMDFKL